MEEDDNITEHFNRVFAGYLDKLPPAPSKVVRIFTSSTFTDTTIERNALMEDVYPKLKDFCREHHGLDFQVVDMRWGVRDEATDDHMTTQLCINEIYNCQRLSMGPNFVVFLCQKYGYRPLPTIVLASEFDLLKQTLKDLKDDVTPLETWYRQDANAVPPVYVLQPISSILINFNNKRMPKLQEQDSAAWWEVMGVMQRLCRKAAKACYDLGKINHEQMHNYIMAVTEREVIHGILKPKHTKDHCLCYVRHITDINLNNLRAAGKFVDIVNGQVDIEASRLLSNLRDDRVPAKLEGTNIVRFTIPWLGREGMEAASHQDYLKEFCSSFYKGISGMVDRAVKKNARYMADKVYQEILHHLHTCSQVSRLFHGRNEELKYINDYITGTGSNVQPLVLYGENGCGKTSVLAKVASNSRNFMVQGAVVIIRFLGTTPDSSSIVPLITSLCEQIAYNYDQPRDVCPTELSRLFAFFRKMMEVATEQQPLLILLDSLDLLAPSDGAHELLWFPPTLNKHVKLIVSTTPGSMGVLETLKRIVESPTNYLEILPLGQTLAEQVIREWLKDSNRTLTSKQWDTVKRAFSKCTLPIFVKLVFATISRWKSYSRPQETMLAGSVHESVHALLDRTESQHGKLLVSHALSYITAAKNGVSESELEDLVSLDDKVLDDIYQYHLPPIRRIPPLLWTRIRSDLPGYLSERDSSGVIVLTWYHKQFSEAATERYFKNLNHLHFTHSSAADYFLGIWAGVPKPFQYTEIQKQRFGIMEREGLADRKVPQQPNVFYGRDGWQVRYNVRKLDELPYHLLRAERIDELFTKCLFNYDFLHSKVSSFSLQALLADFEDAYQRVKDKKVRRELFLVADALRLSASILSKHAGMLGFELSGRLLPLINDNSLVRALVLQCDTEGIKTSALVPMHHCFHSPGGPLKYSMEDHQFAVFGMELTKDKRLLISVSDQFIVWDTSTGDIARTVRPDCPGIMFGLALSPDDRHAAIYNNHNDIVVMHMLTGDFISFRDNSLVDDMSVQHISLTNTEVIFWTKTCWFVYDLHGKLFGTHPTEQKRQIVHVEYFSASDNHIVDWSGAQEDPSLILQSQVNGKKIKSLYFQGGIVFDQSHNVMYVGAAVTNSKVERYRIVKNEWKCDDDYLLEDPKSNETVISLRILDGCEKFLIAVTGHGYYVWNLESTELIQLKLPQGIRNIPLKPLKVTSPISFTSSYELFAAGVRKNIYIWNMSSGLLVQTLDAHFGRILGLLPLDTLQQNSLLSSSLDHTIKLWNMSNLFEKVYNIERLDKPIDSIQLASGDENTALIITRKYATVWNLKLHRIFATLADNAHGAVVTHALIKSDAKQVVTLESSNILVWDVTSSSVIHRETETNVVQMFFVENETILITVQKCPDKDLTARITARQYPELTEIYHYEFTYRKFYGVVVTKGEALLVAICLSQQNRQCLAPISSVSGEVLYKVRLHKGGSDIVAFNAMPHLSNQVVVVEQEQSTIWDIKNKKPLRSIARWSGICSSDGKFGLYAPARGGLELLELKKGHTLRTLIPRVIEGINEIRAEFTPCNTYILYYHNGHKTLRIFRTSDGQLISCFKPHAQLTTFVVSKDARTIVVGGVDGSVVVTALVDPQDPRSLYYLAKQPGRKALADHIGVENIETDETLRSFSNLRMVGKAVNKFKSLINQNQKPSAVCSIQ